MTHVESVFWCTDNGAVEVPLTDWLDEGGARFALADPDAAAWLGVDAAALELPRGAATVQLAAFRVDTDAVQAFADVEMGDDVPLRTQGFEVALDLDALDEALLQLGGAPAEAHDKWADAADQGADDEDGAAEPAGRNPAARRRPPATAST